jgi:hypothetical protein
MTDKPEYLHLRIPHRRIATLKPPVIRIEEVLPRATSLRYAVDST